MDFLSQLGLPAIEPQKVGAIVLETAASGLGKILRSTTTDSFPLAPAPAMAPALDLTLASAPAPAPLKAGDCPSLSSHVSALTLCRPSHECCDKHMLRMKAPSSPHHGLRAAVRASAPAIASAVAPVTSLIAATVDTAGQVAKSVTDAAVVGPLISQFSGQPSACA